MENIRSSSNKQNPEIDVVDPSNELYLHSSDHPNYVLSNELLNDNNYPHWKRSVEVSLKAKNKLGFVKGTCTKPHPRSPLFSQWEKCNSMVISWLLHSIDAKVARTIMYSNTAEEIWRELGLRNAHSIAARIYQLQKDLTLISQESLPVTAYFNKMKILWDEYLALVDVPACTCGSAFASLQFIQNQQVMQFLMGLDDSFNDARRNILMMSPMPSLDQVYHLVLQEELQRGSTRGITSPRAVQEYKLSQKLRKAGIAEHSGPAGDQSETTYYEATQHLQETYDEAQEHTSEPGFPCAGHMYSDRQSVSQGNTSITSCRSTTPGHTTPPLTQATPKSSPSRSSFQQGESTAGSSHHERGSGFTGSTSEGNTSNSSQASSTMSTSSKSLGRCTTFTYEELKKATKGFSKNNLLGQGGFGPVYVGKFKSGKSVAVKLLKGDSLQGEKEFQTEIDVISRVHHKHLVSLVGYCPRHKSLVYEYLDNNSLAFHLHGGKSTTILDWETRMQVALGTGRALAYLHEECNPGIIHRDIKAANILLDSKFRPKRKFGLAGIRLRGS